MRGAATEVEGCPAEPPVLDLPSLLGAWPPLESCCLGLLHRLLSKRLQHAGALTKHQSARAEQGHASHPVAFRPRDGLTNCRPNVGTNLHRRNLVTHTSRLISIRTRRAVWGVIRVANKIRQYKRKGLSWTVST